MFLTDLKEVADDLRGFLIKLRTDWQSVCPMDTNGIAMHSQIRKEKRMKIKRTNKFSAILLTLVMLLGMFPMTAFAAEAPWSGSGTQQDPYQISSAEDLKALAEAINDTSDKTYNKSYFKLTADIDLAVRRGRRSAMIAK